MQLYPKSDPVSRNYEGVPVAILKKPVIQKVSITDSLKLAAETPVS